MSQKDELQNINSISDNKISQPIIYNKMISHKCSLSVDITYEQDKVVTKIFKKLKIILKRPKRLQNLLRSASPRKKINKIYTYQKSHIKAKKIFYTNKSLNSARNRLNINNNIKYKINPININISTFEIIKDTNKHMNNICSILIKIFNNNIYKHKQIFFNKIKYYNKVYHKKHINTNNNTINSSMTVPHILGYNKNKNFLEEINSENSNTFFYNNKSITNDDSFDGNITFINKPQIKNLDDSNSNVESNNNIDNIDNDENSIINRNYSYDKKEMKDVASKQSNIIFKEIKDELYNNSINKKIIISNKKMNINKESLVISEGNLQSINKSKSNLKEKDGNFKSAENKNNFNSNNIKNLKMNKIEFSSRNQHNKKRNLFIDNISFEKTDPNNFFESNKINVDNKKISYLNLNNNSINNTFSDKNNANNNISYLKNKNMKDCYENTCNSFEETTNINEYENNPINKNTFDEEKYIFNNTSMKNRNFEIINSKDLITNNKSNINKEENVIEKSGELYYPVDEALNNEEENELDIKGKNETYYKYNIVDKSKKIISFLSNENNNNKINNNNPIFKAKISLNSYFNIIKKSLSKKKVINIEDEKNKESNNINNKYKMSFSKRSYETFIKQLIDEISMNNYDKDNDQVNNNDILENDIDDLEVKIKNLKKSVLYLLVKKHYLNSMNDKLALISENNEIIDKQKKEIYDLFIKIKDNYKNNNIHRVLDILRQNEIISKTDIKITKYYYKKEKNEEGDENLINYGSLILPFFYIVKFLSTFNV